MWWKNWMASAAVHHRRSLTPVKPGPEQPEAGQHHQRVAVVQRLGLDQPGIVVTDQAAGLGHRPSQRVNLKGLQQVLGPMREHDHHEGAQRELVIRAVHALDERRLIGLEGLSMCRVHVD